MCFSTLPVLCPAPTGMQIGCQIKLLFRQVLFFPPVHSIQNNKTSKPTRHIPSKIIHKMFALFEGISNKLLVLASLLLVFSFMKMMIHRSALRRAGSGCSEGSPPLLPVWGKALQWIRLIQENEGKIFAWQVNTPLSVLVWTELGWTWHFFPFCQKCMYCIAYFHKSVPQTGIFFFQAAKWVSRQLEQTPAVGWESCPNFPKCLWVLWKSEIVQPAPRCEGWRQPPGKLQVIRNSTFKSNSAYKGKGLGSVFSARNKQEKHTRADKMRRMYWQPQRQPSALEAYRMQSTPLLCSRRCARGDHHSPRVKTQCLRTLNGILEQEKL